MEITRAAGALRSTIKTVEADVNDILTSGNFYCTEEIARELTAIQNNLNHLKLDGTLLSSDEWQGVFDPRSSGAAISGATSVLDQTAARLFDYKCQLGAVTVGQKQENEVRELHQWAIMTLKQIQDEMAPYSYGASDRIRQFGDHVGVTDRYTGYRNNLTRGSQEPFKMETQWMDKGQTTGFMNPLSRPQTTLGLSGTTASQRPLLEKDYWGAMPAERYGSLGKQVRFSNTRPAMLVNRGYRTIDSLYPRSTTYSAPGTRAGGAPNYSEHIDNVRLLNSFNASISNRPTYYNQDTSMADNKGPRVMSVQEQAGINTTFPGRTEYMQRYGAPEKTSVTNDFLINPRPDLGIYDRVLGKAKYDPNFTEYQNRYEWPDGEKIVKLPWMRK